MNQFELDDLIVVERVDGGSPFTRPDRERLGAWLTEYPTGELWQKNLIGGSPSGRRDGAAFARIARTSTPGSTPSKSDERVTPRWSKR
jgi:hypothetical protein